MDCYVASALWRKPGDVTGSGSKPAQHKATATAASTPAASKTTASEDNEWGKVNLICQYSCIPYF